MNIIDEVEHDDGGVTLIFSNFTHEEWLFFFRYGRNMAPSCWDENLLMEMAILDIVTKESERILKMKEAQ